MKKILFSISIIALSALGCKQQAVLPLKNLPPVSTLGSWGGKGIGLNVAITQSVIQFNCNAATIAGAFILNSQGNFSLHGSESQALPVEPASPAARATYPIVFYGHISGNTMNATFTQTIGSNHYSNAYTLVKGLQPVFSGTCPICLAGSTRIQTNNGDVAVTDIKNGDLVWTKNSLGHKVLGRVIKTAKRPVSSNSFLLALTLADKRGLEVSPLHPTADHKLAGQLNVGDVLDGSRIVDIKLLPYSGYTYDILVDSNTAYYWANGILLGSTLKE